MRDSGTRIGVDQQVGAFYGDVALPESWRKRLAMKDRIILFADRLLGLAL
jgi:hypothetical protein